MMVMVQETNTGLEQWPDAWPEFSMSEIEKLAHRIVNLPPEDLAKFRAWFAEFDVQAWDRQIEADLKSGKLDNLINEAHGEFKAGKARTL